MNFCIQESARQVPVHSNYDVIVCGGGPSGIAAAIFAARNGSRVCLVENHGFLGGVWTAGLLSLILDSHQKPGLILEIRERLASRNAIMDLHDLYDAEAMKVVLEELCGEAGVNLCLYTRVASTKVENRRITHVVLEGKEGRFAIGGTAFVDATGDGDLAAKAGCGYDLGRPIDGLTQPMTLMALIAGVPASIRQSLKSNSPCCLSKEDFHRLLRSAGCFPSYTKPSLFPLPNGLCALMINHEYERSGLSSTDLTQASINARSEIERAVQALASVPGGWEDVRLVATAPAIGVREGRRILGDYRVTLRDLVEGTRHRDGITRVSFGIDVHSLKRTDGGGYGADSITERTHAYDIPLRALIAADLDNLALAGRCISGDFHAHASYRVTGNAVGTGEAAGLLAAIASRSPTLSLREVEAEQVLDGLTQLRKVQAKESMLAVPAA